MAEMYTENIFKLIFIVLNVLLISPQCKGNDILGCGGFVKSHVSLDYSKIEIGLYSKGGILKEKTECAPTNGYYFLPIYEKGDYILKVHPPPGWSFEPSHVELSIDGETDQCSTGQDVNFSFNGFGITGRVITAGQKQGPSGIAVQLVNDKGEIRNTVTTAGGDFHFTPVIPGQYIVKASHPRWKLDPAQATVQVKEGHTALPVGALAVRGYDVKGTVHANRNPIAGVYVLLYSKEEHPKFRVEGCTTALLQGVPDAPICYSITDQSGEFSFGLVPAGHYKLQALAKSPNQAAVSYNVKPEYVEFSVGHDSQFIKDAFEITGYTVSGVVAGAAGAALRGARVRLDGAAAGRSDGAGRYTLPALRAGVYTLSFEHEDAEFEATQLSISPGGVVKLDKAIASKWRVCGEVRRAGGAGRGEGRGVAIRRGGATITVHAGDDGKWCTFLSPGVYTAEVEVSDAEKKDGLQFFPVSAQVSVSHGPVTDVVFSQLKATVSGTVECSPPALCDGLVVTLRHQPQGNTLTEKVKDGKYSFKDVLPGDVVLSVPSDRYCWDAASRGVAVAAAEETVAPFKHTGYVIQLHAQDDIEVEYSGASGGGSLSARRGASAHCVPRAEPLALTPRGCYLFQPAVYHVDPGQPDLQPVYITSAGAAATIRVASSQPGDVYLRPAGGGAAPAGEGPLPHTMEGGEYVYTHTLYLRQGEVRTVIPESPTLVFTPAGAQQVSGGARCQARALELRAQAGAVARGRLQPPIEGATVTLTADELTLTQVTGPDGSYRFGPVRAGRYRVSAHKDGYVMGAPDADGNIRADKLAEIGVKLTDAATGNPLEGVLVSVSGGSYRRNVLSDATGAVRLTGLAPGEYFLKPHAKEFRFDPPHRILHVEEGRTVDVDLTGARVAWRCAGRVSSLRGAGAAAAAGGAGAGAVAVEATAPGCEALEAATDAQGHFTLRGLLPGCVYSVQLKESSEPHSYKLAHAPVVVQITENKDVEGIRLIAIQPTHLTDVNVLVYTPHIDHYKTLRLKLSLEDTAIYSSKLDAAGYRPDINPGLMYVLPRLPADNRTYVVALESSLSKATHEYHEQSFYFTSDGGFKHFSIEFLPKAKSSQEELRQTSLLVVPLLGILALIFVYREKIFHQLLDVASQLATHTQTKVTKPNRSELLDKASIEQIVNTVNNTGKRQPKKKTQLIG